MHKTSSCSARNIILHDSWCRLDLVQGFLRSYLQFESGEGPGTKLRDQILMSRTLLQFG